MDTHHILADLLTAAAAIVVPLLVALTHKLATAGAALLNQQFASIKLASVRRMALTLVRGFMQSMDKADRVASAKELVHSQLAAHFPGVPVTMLDAVIEEAVGQAKAEETYLQAQVALLDKPQGSASPAPLA